LLQEIDQYALQATLSPYFSQREQMPEPCIDHLTRWLRRASDRGALRTALDDLKRIYWYVLDLLNEVPARAGEVIHNVTPKRLSRGPRSAEVHALGNPQGKEILALEVRRPCPTLRAWDHVRFPMREVQIGPTLAALNLQATRPEEFIAPLEPIAGAPHVLRSIEDESFVVKHLRPTANQPVELTRSETVVTLHGLRGRVQLRRPGGSVLAELQQGTSLVVPAAMGDAVVVAEDNNIEVIKIELTL